MTHAPRRTVVSAASGLAGCLLLAACSSSSPTHGTSPGAGANSTATSTSVAARTSTAGTRTATATPTDSTGAVTACALVTETDATTVLAGDPGPGSRFSSHGSSQCQYGSYQTKFLLVNLTPTDGKAAYDLVHNNPNLHAVELAGVGDRAFEVSGPGTAGIDFTKGDSLVVISLTIGATTSPKDQALVLAKIADGRI